MRRVDVLLFIGAVFSLAVLAGVALAQAVAPVPLDITSFPQWASNPALFTGSLVALVALARKQWPKFDGMVPVLALALIAGGALGLLFQVIGWLSVAPFDTWQSPFGGVAYGFAAAVWGFLGVNLYDLLSKRHAQHKADAASTASAPPTPDASGSLPR